MLAIVLIKGGKWSFANVPSLLKYLMYISIVNRFVCFRTRVTLPFQNCQSFLRGKARFTYIAPVAPCREDPSRQDATGQCDFWTNHNAGFIDHHQYPPPPSKYETTVAYLSFWSTGAYFRLQSTGCHLSCWQWEQLPTVPEFPGLYRKLTVCPGRVLWVLFI